MERAAYAAVGAPSAALKALSARVSDLRDTARTSRRELTDELASEIDEWIAEGEEIVGKAMERFGRSEVIDDVTSSAKSTKRAARIGLDKAKGLARSGIEFEPDEELTVVAGIGPSYADKLNRVGVVGVARLLERTETRDDLEKLVRSSGISEETLTSWRAQVDLSRITGVGESYQHLLHSAGIWTIDQLAAASPTELAEKMRSVEASDVPEQIPTEEVIGQWKTAAKKLSD